MSEPEIYTIDLFFHSRRGTIGTYVVPHSHGCILVETGPGSTVNNLVTGLAEIGYKIQDVSDVFLTHIHLDHAGSAGWWAKQGAYIHVHENGASHLINPEKLLASASRLYGSMMDKLWGDIFPVPESNISVLHDNEVIQINDLSIRALDVPGHASHHLAYLIGNACFTGDITGIRLNSQQYINLPMPPPDFHLEKWRASIQRIQGADPKRIIPTHFGIYADVNWHLQAVLDELDEVEAWMEAQLPGNHSLEDFRQQFIQFEKKRAVRYGVDQTVVEAQQIANPSFMSADGIFRYWNKFRSTR